MDGPNAAQADFWNHAGGALWAQHHARLDSMLHGFGEAALRTLGARPGERILDIGCGTGSTSLALAQAVGPHGAVVGVDVSRPLLAIAEAAGARIASLRFLEADAQTHGFDHDSFDAAFSRFGVMFFAEPVAAFGNILRALKPGGRLIFVCWQALELNDWVRVPLAAALPHLPPLPPPDPLAPGPFAFADRARVEGLLTDAGFAEVVIRPFVSALSAGDLEETLALALDAGPLGAVLREATGLRDAVEGAVRAALGGHVRDGRVELQGAAWIAAARKRKEQNG